MVEMAAKKAKAKEKVIVTRGKRKEAIARASAKAGKGVVRINSVALGAFEPVYVRKMIEEPLRLASDVAADLNIEVSVRGGGTMGQAQAVRTAIGRVLVEWSGDAALRQRMMDFDRFLLVEDSRRVEPKKYLGPKARARFQKSYR